MEVLDRETSPPAHSEALQLDGATLISAVRELADGALSELASDIDRRGVYPETILKRLGELGALRGVKVRIQYR